MTDLVPGKSAQQALDLLRDLLDDGDVGPLDLDADRRLDAGALHHDARADRLHPGVDVADRLSRLVHFGDELVLRHARAATSTSACSSTVVSIIVSGAGSVDVSARPILPKTRSTSGNRLQLLVHLLHDPAGLAVRQTGQRRRHVEDRALVDVRQEVLAESRSAARAAGISTSSPAIVNA